MNRFGEQVGIRHQLGGAVSAILRNSGDLDQHRVRVRMKYARDNRVILIGAAIRGKIRNHPLGGLAIIDDSDAIIRNFNRVAKLAANLVPARIRIADQNRGSGSQVFERNVAPDLQ